MGPKAPIAGREEIDATGKAVSPGFVNMLAHPEESLLVDGRALSDLRQGVTLEVMGERSMGPLSQPMKELGKQRQGDIQYDIDWTTLGEYLTKLEKKGISPNVASFVGAGTVRTYVLGEKDVQPTPAQLDEMRKLVRQAMEEGALGVTTALIYAPNNYAKTPELIELAKESGKCGGMYSVHMRSEGAKIIEAVKETIEIAKASGAPAEIYHLKMGGKENWNKLDAVIGEVERARAAGIRITSDMYCIPAGATGLDAAMPPWVQSGGLEEWIAQLKDPATRKRVIAEMRKSNPAWENLFRAAGPEGVLLLGFKSEKLKPLMGKTIAQVAKERGISPEDAAIDLVIEDGSRVEVAYFLMSEENIKRQIALPWVMFNSDADAPAPEGVFLKSNRHPRTYGNFARVAGQVRAGREGHSARAGDSQADRAADLGAVDTRAGPAQAGLLRGRGGLRSEHRAGPCDVRERESAGDRRRARLGQRRAGAQEWRSHARPERPCGAGTRLDGPGGRRLPRFQRGVEVGGCNAVNRRQINPNPVPVTGFAVHGDYHGFHGALVWAVVYGLDVVAVGVQQKRRVVAGVVGALSGAPLSRPPAARPAFGSARLHRDPGPERPDAHVMLPDLCRERRSRARRSSDGHRLPCTARPGNPRVPYRRCWSSRNLAHASARDRSIVRGAVPWLLNARRAPRFP